MVTRSAAGYLVAAAAFLVTLVDGGSVLLTHIAVPDDVEEVGYAAADVAGDMPTTRQTAVLAYETAQAFGGRKGLELVAEDFTIYPDGRVTVTASRIAPTLLLHRIRHLSDLAVVTETATVKSLPYS